MSFATPAPDPAAGQSPAGQAPPPAAPAEPETLALPPQFEQAMLTIPESLQRGLREQIRETERNHQKALEEARQNSAPPEWADFVRNAQAAGVTPDAALNAYNASVQIAQDPVGFSIRLNEQIDKLISDGTLTAKEGYRMKQDVAAEVADQLGADPLLSPADKEIAELKKQQAAIQQQLEARNQADAQAQAERDAQAYADHFVSVLEQATQGAPTDVVQFIGRNADSLLANDSTGQLTPEKAIEMAVESAKKVGVTFAAPAPQPGQAPPPVGSSAAIPGVPSEKLPAADTPEGKQARYEKMLAAGRAAAALPD